jgi:adapter protein MecA 1/2
MLIIPYKEGDPMRVERIAKDKVRIFISYDELEERGIDRNEMWKSGRKIQEFKKVQELFWDMMETAYAEAGFEISGPIVVEAFTMPAEGVVLIVTRVPSLPGSALDEENGEIEVELTTELYSAFIFCFSDFEFVIQSSHALREYGLNSTLYHREGSYYIYIDEESIREDTYDAIWAILQEYGDYSSVTTAVLEEYGKVLIRGHAIETLSEQFPI